MRAAVGLLLLAAACTQAPDDHRERRLLGFIVEPLTPEPGCQLGPRSGLIEDFQRGRVLLREHRWDTAKQLFTQLEAEQPNYGGGRVREYLVICDRELANTAHLRAATSFLERGDLASGAAEVKQVTPDTLEVDRLSEVQTRLEQLIHARLNEATALLSDDRNLPKLEALLALTREVIAADPSNASAHVLQQSAERKRHEWQTIGDPGPLTEAEHQTRQVAAIRSFFAAGDVAGALAFANSCAPRVPECKALKLRLDKFSGALPGFTGLKAPQLKGLLADAKKISGLPTGGAAGRVIQTQLDQL